MNYFLGAHGTGKSTLTKALEEICPDIVIVESCSRPLSRGAGYAGVELSEVQKQIVLNELGLHNHTITHKVKGGIAARSLLDQIVYSKLLDPLMDTNVLWQAWVDSLDYIENIFFLPIEFPLETDDVRKGLYGITSIQKWVQDELLKLVEQHSSIVTVSGSVEERMKIIKQHLKL